MARYAFTDIHGNYKLLDKILNSFQEADELFFLGDAIDRGEEGIKCIQRLLQDPRITYLLGNHEDTFIKAYYEYMNIQNYDFPQNYYLFLSSGGNSTWEEFQKLTEEEKSNIIYKLKRLPIFKKIINNDDKEIFLCHGGCDPDKIEQKNITKINYIWDRKHIQSEWKKEYKNIFIVHGHTPVISNYFNHQKPEVIQYADNHKINLDMGTFRTNKCAVLDLDSIGAEKLNIKYFDLTN